MGFKKTPQSRKPSRKLNGREIPNDSDLSTSVSLNTSESSTSTCDSIPSNSEPTNDNQKVKKKQFCSLNNDEYLNSESESEDLNNHKNVNVSNVQICNRCDKLTAEITQLRIQEYERWLSEIKSLQDMLFMKEGIIEDFKLQCSEKDNEIKRMKSELTNLKRSSTRYQNEIITLKNKVEDKNAIINDLEYSVKVKNESILQQKKVIEKMEKLAQEDSRLIKKLRSSNPEE